MKHNDWAAIVLISLAFLLAVGCRTAEKWPPEYRYGEAEEWTRIFRVVKGDLGYQLERKRNEVSTPIAVEVTPLTEGLPFESIERDGDMVWGVLPVDVSVNGLFEAFKSHRKTIGTSWVEWNEPARFLSEPRMGNVVLEVEGDLRQYGPVLAEWGELTEFGQLLEEWGLDVSPGPLRFFLTNSEERAILELMVQSPSDVQAYAIGIKELLASWGSRHDLQPMLERLKPVGCHPAFAVGREAVFDAVRRSVQVERAEEIRSMLPVLASWDSESASLVRAEVDRLLELEDERRRADEYAASVLRGDFDEPVKRNRRSDLFADDDSSAPEQKSWLDKLASGAVSAEPHDPWLERMRDTEVAHWIDSDGQSVIVLKDSRGVIVSDSRDRRQPGSGWPSSSSGRRESESGTKELRINLVPPKSQSERSDDNDQSPHAKGKPYAFCAVIATPHKSYKLKVPVAGFESELMPREPTLGITRVVHLRHESGLSSGDYFAYEKWSKEVGTFREFVEGVFENRLKEQFGSDALISYESVSLEALGKTGIIIHGPSGGRQGVACFRAETEDMAAQFIEELKASFHRRASSSVPEIWEQKTRRRLVDWDPADKPVIASLPVPDRYVTQR